MLRLTRTVTHFVNGLLSSAATFNLSQSVAQSVANQSFPRRLNSATINISGHGNLVLNNTDYTGHRQPASRRKVGRHSYYGAVLWRHLRQGHRERDRPIKVQQQRPQFYCQYRRGDNQYRRYRPWQLFEAANHGSAGRPGQPSIAKLEFSASVEAHQSIADLRLGGIREAPALSRPNHAGISYRARHLSLAGGNRPYGSGEC